MRIALTGGNGFIGSRIAVQLQREGVETVAIGRQPVAGLPFHRCDLLAEPLEPMIAAVRPTHLLHTAWVSDRRRLWAGTENLEWVAASLRLILAFRAAGGTRAVIAGSCAEYDWSESLLDEATTPLRPSTVYGRSKRALFDLLTQTPELRPLSIGWGRIFFAFGPNDKPDRLLSQIIDGVAAGRIVDCSEGLQIRPFIHVDDAARALVALLSSRVEGAVNIALDETMAVRDLANLAASHAGTTDLLRFGSRPLQAGEPPLLRAKVERLSKEVGFRPLYSIGEGVRATVAERLA
jgi:nucleoside-diphosphate-sugar epimerase